jgi:sporulation protein YlmC with PRC-barrel domain
MMHKSRWTIGALTLLLAAVGQTAAQTHQEKPASSSAHADEPTLTLLRSEKVLRSKVVGSSGDRVGDINDLLIARHTGRVAYALVGSGGVLGIGERVVAVPFKALTWRENDRAFGLPMSKEQLNDAPSIERDEWKMLAEAPRAQASHHYFNIPQEPADRPDNSRRSSLSESEWPLLRVTDIDGQKLMSSSGEELGKVDGLILDAVSARIAFAVVTFGGTLGFGAERAPLPWAYFDVNSEGRLYGMDLDKEKIRNAPRLSGADGPELRDPKFGARVYSHYGLNAPWLSRPASAAKQHDPADIKRYNKLYNSGVEHRVSGPIVSIDDSSPATGVPNVAMVTLKSPSDGKVTVHLAPKWFLEEQRITLRSGDQVTIEGRWAEIDGTRCLIASQVSGADGASVTLRRKDGDPAWTWR